MTSNSVKNLDYQHILSVFILIVYNFVNTFILQNTSISKLSA